MAKSIGWDNQEIATSKPWDGDELKKYKALTGFIDWLWVLSTCWEVLIHVVERGKATFYFNCALDDEGNGTCMGCQGGVKRQKKWVALIMHIATKKTTDSAWTAIQDIKTWGPFGHDKYKALYDLQQMHGPLKEHELFVSCLDEQMQKLNIGLTGQAKGADTDALQKQLVDAKPMFETFLGAPSLEDQKRAYTGDNGASQGDISFPPTGGLPTPGAAPVGNTTFPPEDNQATPLAPGVSSQTDSILQDM